MSEKKIKRFMHDLGKALDRLNKVLAISIEENELAIEATIQCLGNADQIPTEQAQVTPRAGGNIHYRDGR